MRFLVTAAGAGPGVSVIKAIRSMDDAFVVGVDMSATAAGLYLADTHALIPGAKEAEYVDRILEVCRAHGVGLVVPIFDLETPVLASARARFEAEGIAVAANGLDCVEKANDKVRSYEVCRAAGIRQPERFAAPSDAPADAFPLVGKPAQGMGAQGVVRLCSAAEYLRSRHGDGLLWQRFVAGPEYSIDTWGDARTDRFVAVPRHRARVRDGQMVQGSTCGDEDLQVFARQACVAFGVTDVSCLQCIRGPDGELHFVELNPRYGTGVSLSIAAGVDFPRLQWLAAHEPEGIKPEMLRFEPGVEMIRYWEEIYRR